MIAAVIGGLVLLADDEEGSEPIEPAVERSPEEVAAELAERTLTESLEKEDAGVKAAYPEGWRRSEESGIVSLESPDRCTVISLSAPAAAAEAKQLREDAIAALRQSFKKVEVRRNKPGALGGLPTTGALLAVRNEQGNNVLIDIAVSRGKDLAHLTQVVLRAPPCEAATPQRALIVDSLEFSR